jgi:poly(3-hydroxybutyrate) depolymerase
MKKIYLLLGGLLLLHSVVAQVKSTYIYNTSMPYGTLDLRTTISSSEYYYLQENKTFSYRESSPGVRTNTYLDMTSTWDSSPYKQGNLRKKIGTADKYILNYRLLFPVNYNASYSPGYPLILFLHGAVERGNCYYNSCYHAGWSYDPNVNSPPAPKTSTHKLLNNDHNLNQGGKTHLDARNLAGSKLPNDPTLAARAFPGFVLVPQMLNVWDSLNVQDAIRIVQLVAKKYNIDENRIYVHGLSIGGFATYQALKRAHWLFAAGLPMSAPHDANILKQAQQSKIVPIPLWIFQGGQDTRPTPSYTNNIVNNLRNAGAIIRYSLYADVGHTCWYKAFAEPEFFKWMLQKNKANITVSKGITTINTSTGQYPKLVLSEGFFAYQWQKDGVTISGATAATYIAKVPGVYRARFSRVAAPTSTQWNRWSDPVTITSSSGRISTSSADSVSSFAGEEDIYEDFKLNTYPNPTTLNDLIIQLESDNDSTEVNLEVLDPLGHIVHESIQSASALREGIRPAMTRGVGNGLYIIQVQQGRRSLRQKIFIKK